jgi:hypothetical protein
MSLPMQNSATNPIPIWQGTRPRGRPRGSKNGPNAGAVGRPRKNGQPPSKKGQHAIGMSVSHLLDDRFSTESEFQFLGPHFPHWHRPSHHLRQRVRDFKFI